MKLDTCHKVLLYGTLGFILGTSGHFIHSNRPNTPTIPNTSVIPRSGATSSETDPVESTSEIPVFSAENPLNLNTSTQEELESLNNIGTQRALELLAYREELGKFTSTQQIMDISGISTGIFQELEPYLTVEDS